MKQILISAAVAAVVSLIALQIAGMEEEEEEMELDLDQLALQLADHEVLAERFSPTVLSAGAEPEIAAWVRANSGEGADHKTLASAENSVCFITHMALGGIQSPEDSSACTVSLDDFTGFWQVTASVEEGTQAEVYCNARCVVWE